MATLGMSEAERESIARFEADVINPSMTKLVILDFWAEWCGPCKQLGPTLDKIAVDYADKGVVLAKIDVDADKMIAAQFRVQSIPTVYAIYQGQPVADLTNYRTEGQLTKAIDQILAQLKIVPEGTTPAEEIAPLVAMGEDILDGGDAARAASIFEQVREMAPEDPRVIGGLARALVESGETDRARALIDGLPEALKGKSEIARVVAMLEIAAAPAVDLGPLEQAVAADPDNLDARFALAEGQAAAGQRDAAADSLLAIIAADRDWQDGKARQQFLKLLEAAGLEDSWSGAQRRRLSAILFT